jgi:acetolactate synthase-1/2/3 large subunit
MQTGMPDIELLGQAYGMKGISVREHGQLESVIAEMLAHDGPVVLEVHVKKDENCYPMVAPGKSNSQMVGLPERKTIQAGELIACNNCGTKNPIAHSFCPKCGTKL